MSSTKNFDSSLKLIAKSSIIVLVGIVFSKLLTYIYRIVIAREFGAEVYGLFSLSLMLLGWFTVIALFGLRDGILRFTSRFRGRKQYDNIRYLFRRSFSFLALTGALGAVTLFIFSETISNTFFNEPGLVIFLQITSIIVPIAVLLPVFFAMLRAYEKITPLIFVSHILINLLNVVFVLVFIFWGLGIISVPLSYLLGHLVAFFVSIFILRKQIPSLSKKPNARTKQNKKIFRKVISYSWPLLFAGILWSIFHWTDTFFIGYFKTAEEVGLYNAAIPITSLLFISYELFMKLFYPIVNKEYSRGNRENVKQLSQQVGKWILILNLPVFFILFAFPEALLNILFGEGFGAAANSLRVLSIGSFFLAFSSLSNKLITMTGKSKVIFVHIIIVASVNIVLNLILIPRFGILGAAIATTTSFILISIISFAQTFHYLRIFPIRRKILNTIFPGILSIALLLYLKTLLPSNLISLIVLSGFFFLSYFLLILVFRALDKNDLMIIKSFFRKIKRQKN